MLIENPALQGNPFFMLAPGWAVVPLVVLATLATIIASQAIITGAFSLTRQAMQLGWFPGLRIRQTSDDEYGQIYVPVVNWAMMARHPGADLRLRQFRQPGRRLRHRGFDHHAADHGAAVQRHARHLALAGRHGAAGERPVPGDRPAFFAANLLKIREGGWIPLLLGVVIFILMRTWRQGIEAVRRRLAASEKTPAQFLAALVDGKIPRVPGTAVFLSRSGMTIPPVMINHVAQMKALQEIVVSLTVLFEPVPRIEQSRRAEFEHIADHFFHVTARFGFFELPSLAAALACARDQGCPLDLDDAVYFAARDEVVRSKTHPRLSAWRRLLFAFMYRNARPHPGPLRPAARSVRGDVPADCAIAPASMFRGRSGWRQSWPPAVLPSASAPSSR